MQVRDENMQRRLYVYEAALRKQMTPGGVRSAADCAKTLKPHSANPGAVRTLLRSILAVKSDSISKACDENGEPLSVIDMSTAGFAKEAPRSV